jgi:hypothetical protein
MRRRWRAAALSMALLVAPAVGGQVPDDRPIEPEEYRRASEAVVGLLFPDARRDWKTGELSFPDGRVVKVRLTGLTWAPRAGGLWVASGVEFPDALDEQMKRLSALGRPSERVAARVIVARADAQYAIAAHRVVEIDGESPLSRIVGLGWLDFPRGGPEADAGWPNLSIRGVSAAFVAGGSSAVWWDGQLDVSSGRWSRRAPAEFWRKEGEGAERHDYLVPATDGVAGTSMTLRGATSGGAFSFPCRMPCDIRPYAAMEAIASALRLPAPLPPP